MRGAKQSCSIELNFHQKGVQVGKVWGRYRTRMWNTMNVMPVISWAKGGATNHPATCALCQNIKLLKKCEPRCAAKNPFKPSGIRKLLIQIYSYCKMLPVKQMNNEIAIHSSK